MASVNNDEFTLRCHLVDWLEKEDLGSCQVYFFDAEYTVVEL